MSKKPLLILASMLALSFCSACASINEIVTSDPPGADIYWGRTQGNLKGPMGKTPFSRSMLSPSWEAWCYQVKKSGYYDSEVVCRPEDIGDRKIHFDLKPMTPIPGPTSTSTQEVAPEPKAPAPVTDFVSVTGAATALKRITASAPAESGPKLSPDKKWLLVEVPGYTKDSYKWILQKIDLEGGTRVILSSQLSNSREGDWLPDGSAIIFASDRMSDYTIVRSFSTTGETAVKFISNPAIGPARFPTVSPDGKDIAFSVFRDEDANQICIIGMDGSNLRAYGGGFSPVWSPDGRTLAFARTVGAYSHIYIMDAVTGSNLTELAAARANDTHPFWSPDGEYLCFLSNRVGANTHLFVMRSDGQGLIQLTEGNFDVDSASWGSDGYIYFSANAGGNWDIWRLKPKLQ